MIKKTSLFLVLLIAAFSPGKSQDFIKTSDLFRRQESDKRSGSLNIVQPSGVDTLISRYILANKILRQKSGADMEGFRVQIYRSSNKNARDESNKVKAEFMVEFPDIPSYVLFDPPGYFLVRAGNYRTKMEATKWLYVIRKRYPNAYPVLDKIYFPDLIKN
jgi:hypothetical protein